MDKIKIRLVANDDVAKGVKLISEKLGIELCNDGIVVKSESGSSLSLDLKNGEYTIKHSILPEFFRGLAYCADAIRNGNFVPKEEIRQFDTCGAMIDMSRNAVMKVESVKDMLEYMALMGLNMLMLYTEDTYEMKDYPMFGFMRGRYTKEELKEIDRYGQMLGIEIIPCIQTLSHLKTTLGWHYAERIKDTPSTLYVGREETYEFIDKMLETMSECFTSRRIHIGLDEASDVGLGKRLKEKGYTHNFDLMTEHIDRVCEIASKYDLKPMMWSDMFFKNGKLGGDYDSTSEIPDDMSERLPENIELVYWDYCYEKQSVTDLFIGEHRNKLKRETVFAGGIWTWNRLLPSYVKSFDTARSQLKSCKENGIKTVFATVWYNTCALFNIYSILPGLQMYAENFYSKEVSDKKLSQMFEICTGYKFSHFLALGLDDFTKEILESHKATDSFCVNSTAQHFFNDVLMGLMDKTLSGFDFKSYYKKCLSKFKNLSDMGNLTPLFEQTKTLAQLLVIKSSIGYEIQSAYKDADKEKLQKCADELKTLLSLYEKYHKLAFVLWHKINKPFGWEGCDMLLSGMEGRIKTAILRIDGYLDGDFECIEELEEERIYYKDCESPLFETGKFQEITTVCDL